MSTYLAALIGYVIGGIPTGIWLSKWIGGTDPRSVGSGSSGATNVSRVLGKKWGVVVLLLDAAKGFLPVAYLAPLIFGADDSVARVVMAFSAVAGHVFTPFAGFKGGKGVATSAGAMAGISPAALGWSLLVWLLVMLLTRRVSAASLTAAAAFPVFLFTNGDAKPVVILIGGVIIAAFLFYTHRQNIERLIHGKEPKFF
ncbi:MAG: glycerol-3-phosphate 1-O-acyltransferase PlsY [Calditrichaeota bacterium]|nr:glycerol-3-phosphate 1-O-acyltransferase PlsY [Calditrichota bacterium]MCB9366536.1 glycerol-3-phosphate 1-O-acyltransferase PlsY [Calditrichota bacterium]MCB9391206.1 glycerol-3-phosphate 1-O-acyltransferase PlsY [Calditrichota bacterium]